MGRVAREGGEGEGAAEAGGGRRTGEHAACSALMTCFLPDSAIAIDDVIVAEAAVAGAGGIAVEGAAVGARARAKKPRPLASP